MDNLINLVGGEWDTFDVDIDEMDLSELKEYLKRLRVLLDDLNDEEPVDMNSEEHDDWADRHEELEDCLDEVIEQIEELET